eukprot:4416836-Ditylum_brightwellii.AAC.1
MHPFTVDHASIILEKLFIMEMAEKLKMKNQLMIMLKQKFERTALELYVIQRRIISGNFMSNNSVGGPAHEVEFLDTMEL